MTIHSLKSLSNTAPIILSPTGTHSGVDITIQNVHANAYVYIGANNVTTSSYGYRLAPGSAFSIELPGKDLIYGITDTNESQVSVLYTSLEYGN
jgi:hypothetical protein